MLADEDESQRLELGTHPLFTQMDVLVHFSDNRVGWKEISRYEPFSLAATVLFLETTTKTRMKIEIYK